MISIGPELHTEKKKEKCKHQKSQEQQQPQSLRGQGQLCLCTAEKELSQREGVLKMQSMTVSKMRHQQISNVFSVLETEPSFSQVTFSLCTVFKNTLVQN